MRLFRRRSAAATRVEAPDPLPPFVTPFWVCSWRTEGAAVFVTPQVHGMMSEPMPTFRGHEWRALLRRQQAEPVSLAEYADYGVDLYMHRGHMAFVDRETARAEVPAALGPAIDRFEKDPWSAAFAEIGDYSDEVFETFNMPSIAVAEASRSRRIANDVIAEVMRRDEGRCVECGATFDLQLDHVVPFSRGGGNTVDNLQLLCGPCNRRKGALR